MTVLSPDNISVSPGVAHFGRYDKRFQEKIFQALMVDHDWAAEMVEVVTADYFEVKYLKYLTEQYLNHYRSHRTFPSLGLMASMIRDDLREGNSQVLQAQIVEYFQRVKFNPELGDLSQVKEMTLSFCRKQAMKEALSQAVDLIETGKNEEVIKLMKDAVAVGIPTSVGHDFKEDLEARFQKMDRRAVPTGITELDTVLNGGLGKGELAVVVANTGVGKCVQRDTLVRIRRETVENVLSIGDLFDLLGISSDDETEVESEWDVEIETPVGFKKIEAFRVTEVLPVVRLELEDGFLDSTWNHRVMTDKGWSFLKEIDSGSSVVTSKGLRSVSSVKELGRNERLLDIQVADVACFFSNGILSHNSHLLVNFGVKALQLGKNVLHYTFELSETAVGLRYDSNFCDIPSDQVQDNKDLVLKRYGEMEMGRLIIKEYPTGGASVLTLRSHVEKLLMKSFVPHLILVDYADIMKPTHRSDVLRHDLKTIYEELRNLARELNVGIWTASQSNRESANSEVVGLENMAEAYGKAMVADIVVSLSRRASEKATGMGRLFVAKNRAGRDGLLFDVHVDTARSKVTVLEGTQVQSLGDVMRASDGEMRKKLNSTWKELRGNQG